ncbi:MAG: mechanosensitive ion channel domain-containing protein [Candidatus Aenigmatarchaeota archaeon]
MGGILTSFVTSLEMRIILTLLIVGIGFLAIKIAPKVRKWIKKNAAEGDVEEIKVSKTSGSRAVEAVILAVAVSVALLVLNTPGVGKVVEGFVLALPTILTALLLVALGFLLVNLVVHAFGKFLKRFTGEERAMGMTPKFRKMAEMGVRAFLYLFVVSVGLSYTGISERFLEGMVTASSYALVFIIALIFFFGFKDLLVNYSSGVYLRGSKLIKSGRRVKIGEERGEIKDISRFTTTISTDSGYFMQIPNSVLKDKEILLKRSEAEVDTLEEILDHFSGENSSQADLASMEVVLGFFGHEVSREELGKEAPEDVSEEEVGDIVEELSGGKVKTSRIPLERITNLQDELKAWLNDGALILLRFDKSVIFPETESINYVLCLAVEGDEVLVADPHEESGGVYYVDHEELLSAMEKYDSEAGYVLLSPEETTASWRIKNELLYSKPGLYEDLSKSMELQLSKIMRRAKTSDTVTSRAMADFVERWREEEDLWEFEK